MTVRSALVAFLLTLVTSALAQAPAAPPAKIADMAWLQGYWDGEGFGGQVEDLWMPPRAGMMLGILRVVKAGAPDSYELMGIEEHEGSLAIRRRDDDLEIVVDIPARNGNPARIDVLRYKRRAL